MYIFELICNRINIMQVAVCLEIKSNQFEIEVFDNVFSMAIFLLNHGESYLLAQATKNTFHRSYRHKLRFVNKIKSLSDRNFDISTG